MHKYIQFLTISWQAGLAYRSGMILWRIRGLLVTIMALSLWSSIFASNGQVLNYTAAQMNTYIFLVSVLQSVILATALHGLAGTIYHGDLSYWLLRPLNVLGGLFVHDLADKLRNFGFALLESAAFIWLLQLNIASPTPATLWLFGLWTILAVGLNFIITVLFGCLGFWTNDVWAPKFLFFMLIDATAGKLFPLDILPSAVQTVVRYTPFPYLSYYQTQLFMNRLPPEQFLGHTLALFAWCLGLGALTLVIWKRGLRDYEAVGR